MERKNFGTADKEIGMIAKSDIVPLQSGVGIFRNSTLATPAIAEIVRHSKETFIVHLLETPSRTDFACVRAAYQNMGLPPPKRDKMEPSKEENTTLFLSRWARAINKDIEKLRKLIVAQKHLDFPIIIIPEAVFYGKRPGRAGPAKWWEKWTGSSEQPRLVRKWLKIISSNGGAVIHTADAVNLQDFLSQPEVKGLSDGATARMLLDTLRSDFNNLRRLVLGPPVAPRDVMKEKVKSHPLLKEAVKEEAKTSNRSEWQVWQEVEKHLNAMMADYDVRYIRLWEKVLSWVWRKFFEGIAYDHVGLERVRRLAQKTPVIYVPCHKSHADYLLVSYILFTNHMTPPHIAAGANLSFWPLGYIFRKSGAFFLRRSFRGTGIYPKVFESYLRTIMQEGFDVEFFIEGGRSRTGKLFLPRMGLLSMMIRAFEDGELPDLHFVPISINYDRVPEEEELLQETQLVKLLPPGWRGFWEILHRNNGLIHVNFAAPISLKEYIKSRGQDLSSMPLETRRALYRDFAFRIIRSINEVSVATPNAVAAAALLAHTNHAVEESQVVEDSRWLVRYLEHCRARMTPTLRQLESAIAQALRLNRAQNFIQDLNIPGGADDSLLIAVEPERRPHLEMYKNIILHRLYPASFTAISFLSRGGKADASQLAEDFSQLTLMLKYELVYDTDQTVEVLLTDALDFFEKENLIEKTENTFEWRVTELGKRVLHLFAGQIENFLEAYKHVLEQKIPDEKEQDSDFAKRMLHSGLKAYHLGKIKRREAISVVTFRNARALIRHLSKTGRMELADPENLERFLRR